MVVLKISLPVILIDEFLKWFARNYVEGKFVSFTCIKIFESLSLDKKCEEVVVKDKRVLAELKLDAVEDEGFCYNEESSLG